jgi:hypothetical protein
MHSLAERKKLGKAATVPLIIGQPGPLIMLNPKREEHNLLSGKGGSVIRPGVRNERANSTGFTRYQSFGSFSA